MDVIEFYDGDAKYALAIVPSSMPPPDGAKISIRGKTWEVIGVTYALDHADEPDQRGMRANVSLRATQQQEG